MRHEGLKNIRSYELDEQEYAEIVEALESTRRELGRAALQSSEESEPDPTTWQNECLEAIRDKKEVILSSPTGSGKTRVFMEWAEEKPERPIYITAPIKALSNQRFRELKAQGLNVGLETGDIKSLPEDADIICCTQEIYTNKYVENENATLIVDEFHYIFENQERQRAYIDGIHGSKAKNVLLCSATLGNLSKVNQYVNKVSGRNFFTYENDQRLTSLEYGGGISFYDIRDALVVAFSARKCDYIAESLAESRREKFDADYEAISKDPEQQYEMYLNYMERKADIDELGKEYDVKYISPVLYMGVAAYYGAMLPKEKLFIEKLFEEELIDTVVGTDALALGVNFPVEKVVFLN
ncbi:DEAD/DEAH box helicase [Candidatus Saccharibacteria bacterium]|nr:DEAD/DEAH box helicase [Candidatus Saccharibacteria bacterium]